MPLVAFDFDGTLSDVEMTLPLARRANVVDTIRSITQRAMNGEIGYADSLRERAALLEGLSESDADAAYEEVTLRPDAVELLRTLRAAGVSTAIITGGFESGVDRALEREDVDVDVIVANQLPVENGRLTGTVEGPLVEGTKDEALTALAADLGIDLSDTVAVGDGANDIPMLDIAGLTIGFRPKDAVRPHCDIVVETMGELERVLEEEGILRSSSPA